MMAIMMYVTSFAQTTEHMKFKGVPMEGTLQTFTNKLKYGALKDIAPTILDIMGIPIPNEMTGTSLLYSSTSPAFNSADNI